MRERRTCINEAVLMKNFTITRSESEIFREPQIFQQVMKKKKFYLNQKSLMKKNNVN